MVKPIEECAMPVPSEEMEPQQKEHFLKFFRNLTGKMGTLEGNASPTVLATGGHRPKDNILSTERYQLGLLYAGQQLLWHVLFDRQEPESPPQFLFLTSPSFLQDMDLDELESLVPSLVNWDCDDDRALVKVVNEMIMVFRRMQMQKLHNSDVTSAPHFKMRQLLMSSSLSESDFELMCDHNKVTAHVRLAVDLSRVPELLLPPMDKGRQEMLASLMITLEDSRQMSQLLLSPRMQIIVGEDCRVPNLQSREGQEMNLADYVEHVKKVLDSRIRSVVGGVDARKNFLTALVTLMGRALVENDTESFSKASFLLEWNNFSFLVHCYLPNDFPKSQPIYLFQSVYHACKQRPFASKCSDYPYNSSWAPAEMADKAKIFILEYVAKFQADSIRG